MLFHKHRKPSPIREAKKHHTEASRWSLFYKDGPIRVLQNLLPCIESLIETASSNEKEIKSLKRELDRLTFQNKELLAQIKKGKG